MESRVKFICNLSGQNNYSVVLTWVTLSLCNHNAQQVNQVHCFTTHQTKNLC
jgi:hypothetical protein